MEISIFGCRKVRIMQSNIDEIREKVLELPREQRQRLLCELKDFTEISEISDRRLVHKVHCSFGCIVKSATRGAMAGAGIAGVVNTAAPGIIPTVCGYLVGKGFGDILVQSGLVTLGMFASPSVNSVAVLGVATAFGATLGSVFGLLKEIRLAKRRSRLRRR